MILRNSQFKGDSNFKTLLNITSAALGTDEKGYRKEFLQLVKATQLLTGSKAMK